jgi:hypothetical protein
LDKKKTVELLRKTEQVGIGLEENLLFVKETLKMIKQAKETGKEKELLAIFKLLTDTDRTVEDVLKMSKEDIEKYLQKENKKGFTPEDRQFFNNLTKQSIELLTNLESLKKAIRGFVYPAGQTYLEDTLTFARKEVLKPKHYKETTTEKGKQLQKWETPEGIYLQELIDTLPGLNAPVVTADFVRHMGSIHIMLWKHNRRRERAGEPVITDMEFDLSKYQRQRGRTDEEIKAGGSFTQRARQLILTGATTSFIKREQDNPGGFAIGHFYRLRGTPGQRRGTFLLSLQEPYKEDFLRAYEATKRRSGYIPLYERVINDRSTEGEKDYLMFFVFAVLRQLNTTGKAREGDFIQLRNLLEKARIGEQHLNRDKDAWRCFIEGLQYYNKMTEGLSSIVMQGEAEQDIIINDFSRLNAWTYETFTQEILQPLGLRYCRDLKVAFMGKLPAIKAPETDTGEKLPADLIL